MEKLGVSARIILECILTQNLRVWTGFMWRSLGTGNYVLNKTTNNISISIKDESILAI